VTTVFICLLVSSHTHCRCRCLPRSTLR